MTSDVPVSALVARCDLLILVFLAHAVAWGCSLLLVVVFPVRTLAASVVVAQRPMLRVLRRVDLRLVSREVHSGQTAAVRIIRSTYYTDPSEL
jgi:hypothetical protein